MTVRRTPATSNSPTTIEMDQSTAFSNLPYCLRSYVEGKQWKEFRDVQLEAFDILFNSDKHLLISAGTSSGKTEAAFFPVIADLCNSKPKRISALYISPLIALINDQYDRVSKMCQSSNIEIFHWHSDVSYSIKKKVLHTGDGILHITPESLNGIVMEHYKDAIDMFQDLRFVIIDEIHSFMGSDRGLHLLCELETIEKLTGCKPVRIGLSATMSDFTVAKEWLKANSDREVEVLRYEGHPEYDLKISFDEIAPKDSPERQQSLRKHFDKLYRDTNNYNCLVFVNDRSWVEKTVSGLELVSKARHSDKAIRAHHSSISHELRKEAEEEIKDTTTKTTLVATSTLELGIDIGDLDRVVHINAPQSVSSMVQKMGRSGRRTNHPVMICRCNNRYPSKIPGIETDLIKAIAEAELFLKDHWVEPIHYSKLPYSLLFQQTLAYVKSRITCNFAEMKDDVLSLFPFRFIPEEDYKLMMQHLIDTDVLRYNDHYRTFALGKTGEYLCGSIDFCSNFYAIREIEIICGAKKIGSIQTKPSVGEVLQLAGKSWEVISFNQKTNQAMVKESDRHKETFWKSGTTDDNTEVLRKINCCLKSDEGYDYLDQSARDVLESSRSTYRERGMSSQVVCIDGQYVLYPWMGTVEFETLYKILEQLDIAIACTHGYSIVLDGNYSIDDLQTIVDKFISETDPYDLVDEKDIRTCNMLGKYRRYLPVELLTKQYIEERMNFSLDLESPR